MNTPQFSKAAIAAIFACFFLVPACRTHSDKEIVDPEIDISSVDTIHLDSPYELAEKGVNQNKLFDSIRYIPLETNSRSIFAQIDQLEVTTANYFILDNSINKILIFSKDGKFVAAIAGKTIREFALNDYKKEIVFQELNTDSTCVYDYSGIKKRSYRTPLVRSTSTFLSENVIANYKYYYPEKTVPGGADIAHRNLVYSDPSGRVLKSFLPYDTSAVSYLEVSNPDKQFYSSGSKTYFIEPFSYDVFLLSPTSVQKKMRFSFAGKHQLEPGFARDRALRDSRVQYLKDNPERVYEIRDFYTIDSLVVFKIVTREWKNTLFYNLADRSMTSAYEIVSGVENNFMPITDEVLAATATSIFSCVDSKQLFDIKWKMAGRINEETLPKKLQEFFAHGSNMNNPILIEMFPKT